MLKARDQYNEAASVYFRICGEVMISFFEMTMDERLFSAPDNFS